MIVTARIPAATMKSISANGALTLLLGVVTFVVLYVLSVALTKQIRESPG